MIVSTKNPPMTAHSTTKAASSSPKAATIAAIPASEASRLKGPLPLPFLGR